MSPHDAPTTTICSRSRGRESVLTVTGPVDRAAVVQIEILLRALSDAGASRLLVDLDGVSQCDAALSGAVHRVRRRLAPGDGWLIVDGAPPAVRDDMELSLARTFRIYREATTGVAPVTASAALASVPAARQTPTPRSAVPAQPGTSPRRLETARPLATRICRPQPA
jgi:hypothetical protein